MTTYYCMYMYPIHAMKIWSVNYSFMIIWNGGLLAAQTYFFSSEFWLLKWWRWLLTALIHTQSRATTIFLLSAFCRFVKNDQKTFNTAFKLQLLTALIHFFYGEVWLIEVSWGNDHMYPVCAVMTWSVNSLWLFEMVAFSSSHPLLWWILIIQNGGSNPLLLWWRQATTKCSLWLCLSLVRFDFTSFVSQQTILLSCTYSSTL